jgi:hypothetical protein
MLKTLTECNSRRIIALLTLDEIESDGLIKLLVQLLTVDNVWVTHPRGLVQWMLTNRRQLVEVAHQDDVHTGERIPRSPRKDLAKTTIKETKYTESDHGLLIDNEIANIV